MGRLVRLRCERQFPRCSPTRVVFQSNQHAATIAKARCLSTTRPDLAKGKAKKGGSSNNASQQTDGPSAASFDHKAFEASCGNIIARLQKDLQDLKAGRQNPNILNNIKIPSEDTTLNTLAVVTQKNPKTFLITIYDPAHVKAISSAIASSGQNLNPQPVANNPVQLTVSIPKDSSSARAERQKVLGQKAEQARIQVRALRADALKRVKRSGASDDGQKAEEKTIGATVDRFGKEIDTIAKKELD